MRHRSTTPTGKILYPQWSHISTTPADETFLYHLHLQWKSNILKPQRNHIDTTQMSSYKLPTSTESSQLHTPLALTQLSTTFTTSTQPPATFIVSALPPTAFTPLPELPNNTYSLDIATEHCMHNTARSTSPSTFTFVCQYLQQEHPLRASCYYMVLYETIHPHISNHNTALYNIWSHTTSVDQLFTSQRPYVTPSTIPVDTIHFTYNLSDVLEKDFEVPLMTGCLAPSFFKLVDVATQYCYKLISNGCLWFSYYNVNNETDLDLWPWKQAKASKNLINTGLRKMIDEQIIPITKDKIVFLYYSPLRPWSTIKRYKTPVLMTAQVSKNFQWILYFRPRLVLQRVISSALTTFLMKRLKNDLFLHSTQWCNTFSLKTARKVENQSKGINFHLKCYFSFLYLNCIFHVKNTMTICKHSVCSCHV